MVHGLQGNSQLHYRDIAVPQIQDTPHSPNGEDSVLQGIIMNAELLQGLRTPTSPINLEELKVPYEPKLLGTFLAGKDFQELLKSYYKNPSNLPWHTIPEGALKVTPEVNGELLELANFAAAQLNYTKSFELYIEPPLKAHVRVLKSLDGPDSLIMSSEMVKALTAREKLFVLGRLFSRLMLGHVDFPIKQLLCQPRNQLSPIIVMKMIAWNAASDVSSDRAGLLCCQDLKASTNTILRMSRNLNGNFDVDEYLSSINDFDDSLESSPEQLICSNRVLALKFFFESKTYAALLGDDTIKPDYKEFHEQIDDILELEAPSFLNVPSEISSDIKHFLINSGLLIAEADHEVAEVEIDALLDVLGEDVEMNEIMATLGEFNPIVWWQNLIPLVGNLTLKLSPEQRLNVVRDLVYISLADGILVDSELEVLYVLCSGLQINTSFVDELITRVYSE